MSLTEDRVKQLQDKVLELNEKAIDQLDLHSEDGITFNLRNQIASLSILTRLWYGDSKKTVKAPEANVPLSRRTKPAPVPAPAPAPDTEKPALG